MASSRPLVTRPVLARALRRLRAQHRVSQEVMAELASVNRSYTSGIERGTRRPSFEKIDALLAGMGATWHDFADAVDAELAQHRRRDR
jgi:transcriptional regulator with XRE-family HTH domain